MTRYTPKKQQDGYHVWDKTLHRPMPGYGAKAYLDKVDCRETCTALNRTWGKGV